MKETNRLKLDELIADYLDRLRRGDDVSPEQFIAGHPELREPFLDFAEQATRVIGPAESNNDSAETPHSSDTAMAKSALAKSILNDVDRFVGPYQLIRPLGSGGMSVVYEATASGAAEPVALKVLHAAAANDADIRRRFRREAETIRSLSHQHVVPLRDFGTHDGVSYLAMKLIAGQTVAQQIRRSAKRDPKDRSTDQDDAKSETATIVLEANDDWTMAQKALAIADIADALQHAHQRGVIHRDVKPSNLLIDSHRKVWLTDFGLASANEEQTVLTKTGQLIGTPHYMSPEQASGDADRVDHQADIYSLGASLYEWITLHRPHQGDQFRVLLEISIGRVRPPSKVCPDVPPSLETIVMKAMAHSTSDRYASAAEMASDLRRFASGQSIHAQRPGVADQVVRWIVRNPKLAISSAVGLASVVLAVLLTQYFAGQRLSEVNDRLESSKQSILRTNTQLADTNASLYRTQSRLRRQAYVADMASAYRAYAQQDQHAVQRLLNQQMPEPAQRVTSEPSVGQQLDQRGFEWALLKNLSRPSKVVTLAQHDGPATEAVLGPTNDEAFSVGADGWVRRWDLVSGRPLGQWEVGGRLDAIAISPDGSRIVTATDGSDDLNEVTMHLASTGEVITRLAGHEYSVESAAFSPDGNWIATAGRYHEVLLSDAKGQFHGRMITESRNESLCFSPDSRQLLAVRRDTDTGEQSLCAWTVPHLGLAKTWQFDFSPVTFSLSGDGNRIAAADVDAWAVVSMDDPDASVTQEGVRGRIRCLAIDRDGVRVAAGCDNGLIYVWQMEQGKLGEEISLLRTISAGDQKITSVTFTRDDRVLASREDGTLQVWSLQESAVEHCDFAQSTLALAAPTNDSSSVFVRNEANDIEQWDLLTLQGKAIAKVEPDGPCKLAVTPDGNWIAAGSIDEVVIVSTADQSVTQRIRHCLPDKASRGLAFIDNGQRLLVLMNDRFRCYRTADWELIQEIELPNQSGKEILSSPDDSVVLIITEDAVLWYDAITFEKQGEYPRRFGPFNSACYTANGQTIAVGHMDGPIELLSASLAKPIALLQGHRYDVEALRFIDNDRTLISSGMSSRIRFWDVASGHEIAALDVGETGAKYLHFSQPLQKLFTFGPNQPGQVWSGELPR